MTQSNDTTAAAIAANGNKTTQGVDQSQMGGYGSDQTQIAGQEAKNAQHADADATALQIAPKNEAGSLRVLSPGDNGDVTQSNSAGAGALAANGNSTDQTADQSQAGGGYGSDATQIAGQAADNHQSADANATAAQVKPTNDASSIRVLSPGDDGNVTQSNNATAVGIAANGNKTDQSIDQSQGGQQKEDARPEDAKSVYPSGSSSTQIAGQSADNKQSADVERHRGPVQAEQHCDLDPRAQPRRRRERHPVEQRDRSRDRGERQQDGPVDRPVAGRTARKRTQGRRTRRASIRPARARRRSRASPPTTSSRQTSNATAVQYKPSNTATSIRVLSPGDDGNVTQSNDATALGIAANGNATSQSIGQTQAGGGGYGSDSTQIAGQEAGNYQSADANATAVQVKPSNSVSSIRVLSPGNDGDVTQSNNATALGVALNLNTTDQSIDQQQTGSGHGSDNLQVAGQGAWSGQYADADATAVQLGAKNEYAPVRVGSPNGKDKGRNDEHGKDGKKDGKDNYGKDSHGKKGGSVEQTNSVGAVALALNLNETCQALQQKQAGHGSSLQVAGQGSWSGQGGSADAFGYQGVMHSKK